MENILIGVMIALIIWNSVTFFVMGYDKWCAATKKWRVPEKNLFLMAWAFGGVGIGGGMICFRHKTRHWSFRILVPLGIIFDGFILWLAFSDLFV